ncbi:hypothetical protein N7508_004033 [Penicillium antarcticum]|nr:uncharacterized protein N7508_004033 [Penicillium antarcticum]KAJ5308654.1 hypothetical protein N7508_004033 [Penicillium antarcticum]
MTSDMYDSDDAYNRSPGLEATKVNYGDNPSPPPFVPTGPKDGATGSRKPAPETQTSTSEGDRVLMGFLAPNHPEIAISARESPLDSDRKSQKQPKDFDPRKLNPFAKSEKEEKPLLAPIPKEELRERLPSISERPADFPFSKTPPDIKSRLPSLQPIQASPASCANSPESSQTLPSIRETLSALTNFGPHPPHPPRPFSSCPTSTTSGNDSPYDRPFPAKFPIPPSPYSHYSPVSMKDSSTNPSPASHGAFWRGPQTEILTAPTPYEASPMSATSPTSYPTPTEQVGTGMSDRVSLAASTPQANGGPTGSYKCTHPGCTAAPFQTQYLLNSHANVHSQDRPHFCPVEGCPRALGGKGFKRKNEMMRHGLVHNSPGYVCPFCPDQQHKYPRPDNLQRHVRVHHVDKNKDDPILRQVLAQRPIGSARGRKRRMNNT